MIVEYYDNKVFINGITVAKIKHRRVIVYLRDDKAFAIKAGFIDAFEDFHMTLKITADCTTVILNTDEAPDFAEETKLDYENYIHSLIELFDDCFDVEISDKGNVKVVGDCISIIVGKQTDDEIEIYLNSIYNKYVKNPIMNYIDDIEEQFHIITTEDTIVICFEDSYRDRIHEMFDNE